MLLLLLPPTIVTINAINSVASPPTPPPPPSRWTQRGLATLTGHGEGAELLGGVALEPRLLRTPSPEVHRGSFYLQPNADETRGRRVFISWSSFEKKG